MGHFPLVCALICILFKPLSASVSGRILAEGGAPVAFPQIENLQNQSWVTGDNWGYFYLSGDSLTGQRIAIHRIGFLSDTISISDETSRLIIHLKSAPISFSAVAFEGKKPRTAAAIRIFSIAPQNFSVKDNSRSIMHYLPGITLKQYGGPGSISTLSMDGGNSQNLTIVYGAVALNSLRNGSVDFSQLPFTASHEIEYLPVALSGEPQNGADGVLRLSAAESPTQIQMSFGSYGHRAISASMRMPLTQSHISLSGGYREDTGNYLYQRWRDKQWIERRNNNYQQRFIALNGGGICTKNFWWRLTALGTEQNRGVPGLSWAMLDTTSFREDRLLLLGVESGWLTRFGDGKIAVSTRQNKEYYENRNYFIYADSEEGIREFSLNHRFPIWKKMQPHISYSRLAGSLLSGATGKKSELRQKSSASIRVLLGEDLSWMPQIIAESIADSQWSASWQSELQGRFFDERLYLLLLAGENRRHPTLNDRYWQPGGNPNLKPELTRSLQLWAQYEPQSGASLFLQIFSKQSKNLIQWVPQAAYWAPANIRQVSRRGLKSGAAFSANQNTVFRFSYSFLETKDLALKKPLRYAPTHQLRVHGIFSWRMLTLKSDLFYQSSRIFMYNYPEDILDAGMTTVDTELAWNNSGRHTERTLSCVVTNLFNNRYESVLGYPEPGREWRMTLTIKKKG
ncbi:MAG TPA: TonB-dependent receptor [Candidatus Marinimicrobia bacterium]|nr:TonB-dependent receptor [Candidatus Neomarinimicrobiota bacterium]